MLPYTSTSMIKEHADIEILYAGNRRAQHSTSQVTNPLLKLLWSHKVGCAANTVAKELLQADQADFRAL